MDNTNDIEVLAEAQFSNVYFQRRLVVHSGNIENVGMSLPNSEKSARAGLVVRRDSEVLVLTRSVTGLARYVSSVKLEIARSAIRVMALCRLYSS
jgi:hypothetical protein